MNDPSELYLRISGPRDEECQKAIDEAIERLTRALSPNVLELLEGTEVVIGEGIINSGAQTLAEEKKIILDGEKNALSLQQAEDFLVSIDVLNVGDWTKVMPQEKDVAWSCLTYQLVHEFGHVIDGLSAGKPYERLSKALSPTKYGEMNEAESFAEAFTYWVFESTQDSEAMKIVELVLSN